MNLTNDQKIIDALVKKAWKNTSFKNELITNPLVTIETFLDRKVKLPEGMKITFVDQTDNSTIYINIPAEPNYDDVELNFEELDVISGGTEDSQPPILIKPNNYSDEIFKN